MQQGLFGLLPVAIELGSLSLIQSLSQNPVFPMIMASLPETPLHLAIKGGHQDLLEYFLRIGHPLDVIAIRTGDTPLHYAVRAGSLGFVKSLIQNGSPLSMKNKRGESPLWIALLEREAPIAEYLLSLVSGESLQEKEEITQKTFLHLASEKKLSTIIPILLSRSPTLLRAQTVEGKKPLHLAIETGDADSLLALVSSGTDLNGQGTDGMTPLMIACKKGMMPAASTLLKRGADITVEDSQGRTALSYVVSEGHHELLTLPWNRALFERQDKKGKNLLHLACERGHERIVTFLIKEFPSLNVPNIAGDFPIHIAAKKGFLSMMKLIDSYPDRENQNQETPLALLFCHHHFEQVADWIKQGAHLMRKNGKEETYLHLALHQKDPILTRFLALHFPELIEQRDQRGRTALLFSCRQGFFEGCQILLEAKGEVCVADSTGNFPLHLAAEEGHSHIVEFLLHHRAEPRIQNQKGEFPIHLAAEQGHYPVIKELLFQDSSLVFCQNREGKTPLHLVASRPLLSSNQDSKLAEILLRNQAEVNVIDFRGDAPLHFAAKGDRIDLVHLLIRWKGDPSLCNKDKKKPEDLLPKSSSLASFLKGKRKEKAKTQ